MAYFFTPPTTDAVPPIYTIGDPFYVVSPLAQRLFRHYGLRKVGSSVLKQGDGSYLTTQSPTQDQCDAATAVYIGGHTYPVTAAEKTSLEGAGFTVTDDGAAVVTPPPTSDTYTDVYTDTY